VRNCADPIRLRPRQRSIVPGQLPSSAAKTYRNCCARLRPSSALDLPSVSRAKRERHGGRLQHLVARRGNQAWAGGPASRRKGGAAPASAPTEGFNAARKTRGFVTWRRTGDGPIARAFSGGDHFGGEPRALLQHRVHRIVVRFRENRQPLHCAGRLSSCSRTHLAHGRPT